MAAANTPVQVTARVFALPFPFPIGEPGQSAASILFQQRKGGYAVVSGPSNKQLKITHLDLLASSSSSASTAAASVAPKPFSASFAASAAAAASAAVAELDFGDDDEKEAGYTSFLCDLIDPRSNPEFDPEQVEDEIEERILGIRFPNLYEGFIEYVQFRNEMDPYYLADEDSIYSVLIFKMLSEFASETIKKLASEKRVDFSRVPFASGKIKGKFLQSTIIDCFKGGEEISFVKAKLAICKAIAIHENLIGLFEKALEGAKKGIGVSDPDLLAITADSIEAANIQFI